MYISAVPQTIYNFNENILPKNDGILPNNWWFKVNITLFTCRWVMDMEVHLVEALVFDPINVGSSPASSTLQ